MSITTATECALPVGLSLPSGSLFSAGVDAPPAIEPIVRLENVQTPVVFAVGMASANSSTPVPVDVLELLMSAVLFAELIVQLDYLDQSRVESACYDALADLKQKLNNVTFSRALE